MAAICFTLLCISLPVALWKENKDSLHLGKCLLWGNCHHIAAISEFKMAATLLDMQFSMLDRCRLPCQLSLRKLHCRSFSVSLSIQRYLSTYHKSRSLLIAGPTTFAKGVHSGSLLKHLPFPLQDLAYLHDICSRQATSAIGKVVHF